MSPQVYLFNAPSEAVPHPRRNVSGYCALTYGVLEGLHALGVPVRCAHDGLCARDVGAFDPAADVYLVQREPHVDTADVLELLQRHGALSRTVFLDSMDRRFGVDWFWRDSAAAYFKSDDGQAYGTESLQFCIQNRFIPATRPEPQDVVFFVCSAATHPERRAIRRVLEKGPWNCEFGPLVDTDQDSRYPSHRVGGHHNRAYYRRLSECRVAVNARGGAVDCYRYWEIAASHAVLVSIPVEEELPGFRDPPTPGVHYVAYRSPDELPGAIEEAFDRYDELHDTQREFFLANHRSRNRALTVLNSMGLNVPVVARPVEETVA